MNNLRNVALWVSGMAFLAVAGTGCAPAGGGGGGGGGGNNTNENTASNDNTAANDNVVANDNDGGGDPVTQLFVTNQTFGITSYANPATLDDRVEATTSLDAGSATQIFGPRDAVVGMDGALFVCAQNGNSIVIFDNATTASGETAPDRVVSGTATLLDSPLGFAIDNDADVLFVANGSSLSRATLLAFDGVSQPGFDTEISPSRLITPDVEGFSPLNMTVSDGTLYVVGQVTNTAQIYVFDNAATLDDTLATVVPDRTITAGFDSSVVNVAVDSQDRLLVNDESTIYVWNDAILVDGATPPDITLTIDGAGGLGALAADSADNLYVADQDNNVVYVIFDLTGQTSGSTVTPDNTFDDLDLRLPSRFYLLEE